jgi:aminopeptidase
MLFNQKLQNYADIIINIGLGLAAGQRLVVRAPVEAAPLVRLAAASAYKAGARLVDVLWHDDALSLARFNHAPRDSFAEYPDWYADTLLKAAERGDAVLTMYASDPDLLNGQDKDLIDLTQRTANEHLRPFRRYIMADDINWCLISLPIPAWAAKLFPTDPPEMQMSKLWDVIFATCRADQADPLAAWRAHTAQLDARRHYLNAKQYTALHYTDPGTDLTVGLPENHHWEGGESRTPTGITFIANMPTEEVYTLPHKDKVNGVVTASKPLFYGSMSGGTLIEAFTLTFENGRVVKATAEKNEVTLKKMLDTDAGAAQLGEVALVPQSSPVAQANLLFYNTLSDEHAASHLALGRAYKPCLQNGTAMSDEEFFAAGGNDSLIHEDFMIGSARMDIDGLTRDGVVEPVMRGGEWAF